jgi:hypothetical protein
MLHTITQYGIIVLSNNQGDKTMAGRPKTKRGMKVHTAFKIYPDDKARAQAMADKLDMSLSSYINKAVLEKVARDEKSEA